MATPLMEGTYTNKSGSTYPFKIIKTDDEDIIISLHGPNMTSDKALEIALDDTVLNNTNRLILYNEFEITQPEYYNFVKDGKTNKQLQLTDKLKEGVPSPLVLPGTWTIKNPSSGGRRRTRRRKHKRRSTHRKHRRISKYSR